MKSDNFRVEVFNFFVPTGCIDQADNFKSKQSERVPNGIIIRLLDQVAARKFKAFMKSIDYFNIFLLLFCCRAEPAPSSNNVYSIFPFPVASRYKPTVARARPTAASPNPKAATILSLDCFNQVGLASPCRVPPAHWIFFISATYADRDEKRKDAKKFCEQAFHATFDCTGPYPGSFASDTQRRHRHETWRTLSG